MYEEFVRNRITQLRIKKGVSEYQMSYDLGIAEDMFTTFRQENPCPLYQNFSQYVSTSE